MFRIIVVSSYGGCVGLLKTANLPSAQRANLFCDEISAIEGNGRDRTAKLKNAKFPTGETEIKILSVKIVCNKKKNYN